MFNDKAKDKVYKNSAVVNTYDRRLYFGRSKGLFYEREVSTIRDWFPENGRILDVPCGTGKAGRFSRKSEDLQLYGVDISHLMLKAAAKTSAYNQLIMADMGRLPFSDGFFDVVYVSRFFMLFSDIEPFFIEIRRVLHPEACSYSTAFDVAYTIL